MFLSFPRIVNTSFTFMSPFWILKFWAFWSLSASSFLWKIFSSDATDSVNRWAIFRILHYYVRAINLYFFVDSDRHIPDIGVLVVVFLLVRNTLIPPDVLVLAYCPLDTYSLVSMYIFRLGEDWEAPCPCNNPPHCCLRILNLVLKSTFITFFIW